MAGYLGNAAKLGIGATPNYIASGRNIMWDPGEVVQVPDELLNTTVDTLSPGSRTNATIKITVLDDSTDTNGQVAIMTAWKAGTDIAITLAPQGTTAGSKKITGNAKVKSPGSVSFEKNKFVTRDISLIVNGDYVDAVFP